MMKSFIKSRLVLMLVTLVMLAGAITMPLSGTIKHSHAAADVLILSTTVTNGTNSLEAQAAQTLGMTVNVVDPPTWGSMTSADFTSYKAIVLGDPTCEGDPSALASAEANTSVWGPAINGNVVVIGTDPVYHAGSQSGAKTLISNGIAFATSTPGKTGAYIDLSCYYYTTSSGTAVPVLNGIASGGFTVEGQGGCPDNSHIVGTSPVLTGLTDASLSNWSCSTHEGFVTWPSDFQVQVISKDIPSSFVAPDGTSGAPYILARGSNPATSLVDFRLGRDGYSFPNWSDPDAWAAFKAQWGAMIATNNPADISGTLLKAVLLPFTYIFYQPDGYCFGMASTSILYMQYPDIKPVPGETTFQLTKDQAQDKIVEYHQKQFPGYLDSMRLDLNGQSNPTNEYNSLLNYLQNEHKPAMLVMLGKDGGHAVVAYNVIDHGNTKIVQVYDNNFPNQVKTETFDLSTNSFKGSTGPYTFDRVFVRYPSLDFPDSTYEIIRNTFYAVLSWLRTHGMIQIHLHSPVTGLVTDSQGHRFGYVNGVFVNEIPSAQIFHLDDETVFYVPDTSQYTLTTTGTSAATSTSTMGVDITAPTSGTLTRWISYQGVPVSPGSMATLTVGSTNTNYKMLLSSGASKFPDTVETADDASHHVYMPPTTTASVSPTPNTNGWNNSDVTVSLNATSGSSGSNVKQITYSASGAQTIPNTTVVGSSASINITTEGITTITYYATDNFDDQEVAKTVTVQLDKTPPTVTCSVSPNMLWPPNHNLVPVTATVTVTDALSGPAGFTLVSVTSNEPDSGLGDGDTPNDIQGFVTGTASINGLLRAERAGGGTGRIYTLNYEGMDKAGNSAACTTTVTVPHDQKQ